MGAGVAGVPTGKQQKAPAGANRRALGDIGNLVNGAKGRPEEGYDPSLVSIFHQTGFVSGFPNLTISVLRPRAGSRSPRSPAP